MRHAAALGRRRPNDTQQVQRPLPRNSAPGILADNPALTDAELLDEAVITATARPEP